MVETNINLVDSEVLDKIFEISGMETNLPQPELVKSDLLPELEESIANLDKQTIDFCENKKYKSALQTSNEAVLLAPKRSASYNNRAQVYRLLNQNNLALKDLNKCLELSESKGSVAAQALCQRASLKILDNDEQGAFEDFESAAKLGSNFAKDSLVRLNPMARLCSQMVSSMMKSCQHDSHTGA